MDRLSYGRSSFCQDSRRLVFNGKMTMALSERNADTAHELSIQKSDRDIYSSQWVAWKPTVRGHSSGFSSNSGSLIRSEIVTPAV